MSFTKITGTRPIMLDTGTGDGGSFQPNRFGIFLFRHLPVSVNPLEASIL